jgi:hypothetical protein
MGLRAAGSFQAAPTRATVLRRPEPSPYVRLRTTWRTASAARPFRSASGRPRPEVTMHWARSERPGTVRRPSAAPAPWRA